MKWYACLVYGKGGRNRIWCSDKSFKDPVLAREEAEWAKASLVPVVVNGNRRGTSCYPGLALDADIFPGYIGPHSGARLFDAPPGALDHSAQGRLRIAWRNRSKRYGASESAQAMVRARQCAELAEARAVRA